MCVSSSLTIETNGRSRFALTSVAIPPGCHRRPGETDGPGRCLESLRLKGDIDWTFGGAGFNGHIDEFRIAHIQRSDGWIETTWNNMSDPGAFAVAGAEEQAGGEPPPLAGTGVVVCLMA